VKANRSNNTPLSVLKGVGDKVADRLRSLGASTVEELLFCVPRAYQDRSNPSNIPSLQTGSIYTIRAQVLSISERRYRTRQTLEVMVSDGSGVLVLKWFRFGKWLKGNIERKFPPGTEIVATGKVDSFAGQLEMHHADLADSDDGSALGIVPIYTTKEGITQQTIRRLIPQAMELCLGNLIEKLPDEILKKYDLPSLRESIQMLHLPENGIDIQALNSGTTPWHYRLKFEELVTFQLGILARRRSFKGLNALPVDSQGVFSGKLTKALPFSLTGAQVRSIEEISGDMAHNVPMHRLLQGDVGSGKTLVAYISMLNVAESGAQAVLMAPTEVLAEQHFRNFSQWGEIAGIRAGLLTGSTPASQRREILAELADGTIPILVGTHALIQEGVNFRSLSLAVIDEQHRFGVLQRLALRKKGMSPHFLVMTATPIPRSLSLVMYGDLDISTIDELPPGRKPVRTEIYRESDRAKLHLDVAREVSSGGQVFIVYPLVEESEKSELSAANEMAEHYREKVFPHLKIGLITGRMSSEEKDRTMEFFRKGEYQVLVATTVIEVGVDIPNASLMVIEHAERFGLFQLHQLRGRVGRGEHLARCILVAGSALTDDAKERLNVMLRTASGFDIAEADLRIRGPGDFLGTRQAGMPDFRFAHPVKDRILMLKARDAAESLFPEGGEMPEILKKDVEKFWSEGYVLSASG